MSSFLLKVLSATGLWGASVGAISSWKIIEYFKTSLVFGNYQDYISPEMVSEFRGKYNVSFDYFEHDANLREKFDRKFYDMSIVSTSLMDELIKNNSVAEIDWTKFNLKDPVNTPYNKDNAKLLFSEATRSLLDSNNDLLKYGIPYFLSKFSFYYTGEKINGLHVYYSGKSKKQNGKLIVNCSGVTFSKLIEIISKEPRFKSVNNSPKLAIIDDPRTLLSFARLVSGKKNVNPSENEYKNSDDIFKDYKSLIDKGLSSKKLGNNFLLLNPNSATVVDSLVAGSVNGAFMYNGDGFFAASGGNIGKDKIQKDKFHTVEITDNLVALDFLVFSQHLSEEKKTIAYNIAKDLIFSGYDVKNMFSEKNGSDEVKPDEKLDFHGEVCLEAEEYKEDVDYKYGATRNFDFVQYTPALNNLAKQLFCRKKKNIYLKPSDKDPLTCIKRFILQIDKLEPYKNRFNKEWRDIDYFYEKNLSIEVKNNIILAYEKFKSYL